MELKFEYEQNLTEGAFIAPSVTEQTYITHEPKGELYAHYTKENITREKLSKYVPYLNYPDIKFEKKASAGMTLHRVNKIGVKAFPGLGSYGFFKDAYTGLSNVVIPIHTNKSLSESPKLEMKIKENSLLFTITNPNSGTHDYKCYRVVLSLDEFSYEYITYESKLECPLPEVKGTYSIYCVGYLNEGSQVSEHSNILTYTATEGRDSFAIASKYNYATLAEMTAALEEALRLYYTKDQIDTNFYNKQEIDLTIGNIGSLIDKINGEEI